MTFDGEGRVPHPLGRHLFPPGPELAHGVGGDDVAFFSPSFTSPRADALLEALALVEQSIEDVFLGTVATFSPWT